MPFVNPLDRVPQIRSDYANHIVYGGILGVGLHVVGLSPVAALGVTFVISAAKKIVDYYKESESLGMCVAKTFVTCIWPATLLF